MLSSVKTLLSAPYNKKRPVFALQRFAYWKFIRLLRRKNVVYNLWDNRQIYLNHDSFQSMWIMYNYIVDWEEFNLIKKFIKNGDTVADVGANMGFYSVWMSKYTTGFGAIHSFEPDIKNFDRLKKNIALNNLQQVVTANNKGLGAANAQVLFTNSLDGENHITTIADDSTVTIQITTLDNYCRLNNINQLQYCKIDVEGFEMDVLKGASNMLASKKIAILQLEINNTLQNSQYRLNDLLEYIETTGYSLCRYDVAKNNLIPIKFMMERENYFAVADIATANNVLRMQNKN